MAVGMYGDPPDGAPTGPARRLDFRAMSHEIRDITIIGGGPTGIFAQFYAGMRKATAQIVDALPELGGQLTALYPEKYIFDVAGFPKVLAKDLVKSLAEQAAQFKQPIHLGQRVVGLEEEDGHFVLVTETGAENLTAAAPAEVEAVYALVKQK